MPGNTAEDEEFANAMTAEEAADQSEHSAAEEEAITAITDEQGNEAAALLRETIEKMGIQATVEFKRGSDNTACLSVASEDGAILIGRKGRNLSAMQYLINRMISHGDKAENTERLMVDVEGYVDRRRESLEEMARGLAARAKESGRVMRLKPLSPQERRVIHLALQEDAEVRTYSLGSSLYRSVVISPVNARPEQDRPRRRRPGGGGFRRGGRGNGGGRPAESDFDAGQFGD